MKRLNFFHRLTMPLLFAGLTCMTPVQAASVSFALFGDVYMTGEQQGYLKGMLDDMAQKQEELAIFTGGLKPAAQTCQDQNLIAAYPVFARAPLPTFYVPGDAEWTLCTRFAPEERLQLLRKTYYQSNRSLGDPSLPLAREPQYPELMRWQVGDTVFVTLNVTGNNNRWGTQPEASSEFQERSLAGLNWLKEAFKVARASDAPMLVIVMHGDPGFEPAEDNTTSTQGYQPLIDLLKQETESFPGQILVVHGGSGVHRIDHPLINASNLPYQNFTRVETYGALQQGWVEVRVERNDKAGDDPIRRTEFKFQSFPWPPLTLDAETPTEQPIEPPIGQPSEQAAQPEVRLAQ